VSEQKQRSIEERLREVEDRLEIYNLIAAHPPSADTAASDFIAACWTEDGVFDRELATNSGRAAIAAEVLAPAHQAAIEGGIAHFAGLPHVVIDGNTAVVTSYLQIIVPDAAGETVTISGHGASKGFRLHRVSANRWELARGPHGWQIKRRTLRAIGGAAARQLLRQGIEPER
jgi:SnoaL-like domain